MVKKLKLKPSAKDKRRYFLVKATNQKIETAILEYIGVLGFAKSAYMKVNSKDFAGKLIGSCLVKSLEDVRASLAFVGIRIEKVSGTLKGLKG
jgi:RNase P/RNase MRP subunit POP5